MLNRIPKRIFLIYLIIFAIETWPDLISLLCVYLLYITLCDKNLELNLESLTDVNSSMCSRAPQSALTSSLNIAFIHVCFHILSVRALGFACESSDCPANSLPLIMTLLFKWDSLTDVSLHHAFLCIIVVWSKATHTDPYTYTFISAYGGNEGRNCSPQHFQLATVTKKLPHWFSITKTWWASQFDTWFQGSVSTLIGRSWILICLSRTTCECRWSAQCFSWQHLGPCYLY